MLNEWFMIGCSGKKDESDQQPLGCSDFVPYNDPPCPPVLPFSDRGNASMHPTDRQWSRVHGTNLARSAWCKDGLGDQSSFRSALPEQSQVARERVKISLLPPMPPGSTLSAA